MKTAAYLIIIIAGVLFASQEPAVVTFRAESRLVEIYATVLDHRGRYIDGLTQTSFRVTDNGEPQRLIAFEDNAADFSCAILLDTTGSMTKSFPFVRNAILRFISELRAHDQVAIYGFSTGVEILQQFTNDKTAAKEAVLRTRASGKTALYDSISRVAEEVAGRKGKKAVVVFTDGDDNASVLNMRSVVEKSKKLGVPIYTVARGEALSSPELFKTLKDIADLTGAKAYAAKRPEAVSELFRDISAELQHTYLLVYRPPEPKDNHWRPIQVAVDGVKEYAIRAKQGYYPQ